MKRNFMYFVTAMVLSVSFAFYSCEKEEDINVQAYENRTITPKKEDVVIGIYDGNKFQFVVPEGELLNNWNKNLERWEGVNPNLTTIKFEIINGNYYLRARGAEYASTVLLKGTDKLSAVAGITCTSKTCSTSSTSCVPDTKTSCTSCWSGDCTKSVSGLMAATDHYLSSSAE